MTRKGWVALVVLVVIGIGLLVAVVAVPWSDDAATTQVYHQGDSIDVAVGEDDLVRTAARASTRPEPTRAGA